MAKKKEIALIFADAHLQRRTWKHRPIIGDAYHAWKQIFDYAIKHNIYDLFGLGDLFDNRVNEPSPLAFVEEQFWRLRNAKAGHTLHYIQGQHELDDVRCLRAAELMGVARHMHRETVQLVNGMTVYGMDYQPADRIKGELALVPENADILMGHQVIADFMGDICLPQMEFADVPHVSKCVFGDYHQWVHETGRYRGKHGQKLEVLSTGATHQTPSIDSPSDCFFAVIMDDGTIEQRRLDTRNYQQWQIVNNDQLEEFLAAVDAEIQEAGSYADDLNLPDELRTPLWRVIYSSRIDRAEQRIDKAVAGRAHMFYKEKRDESEEKTTRRVASAGSKALTLSSVLAEEVDRKEQEDVFQLCQRLLDAGDSKDEIALELQAWKKEVLSGT